jgi:hypothetical protein
LAARVILRFSAAVRGLVDGVDIVAGGRAEYDGNRWGFTKKRWWNECGAVVVKERDADGENN